MRYSTRVKIRKYVIIAIIALVLIAINIWIFVQLSRPRTPLEKKLIELPLAPGGQVFAYDNGVLLVGGQTLIGWDIEEREKFNVNLPLENMQAWRGNDNTIVWAKNFMMVIDAMGQNTVPKELDTEVEILMARCSKDTFAAVTVEEEQHWLRVYDMEGNEKDEILFPSQSVLDFGYYGDENAQMWALSLDSHGTLPISHLSTYQPGKSMTGKISVNDQVCYEVIPRDKVLYTVGVHHIQAWNYIGETKKEYLVYGWTLQDFIQDDKNEVSFLLTPASPGETEIPLSALWYIGANSDQYRVSLPAGILRVVMSDRNIYAISKDGVYELNIKGEMKRFHKMPFKIDEVAAVIRGKGFVLRSDGKYYLIPVTK